MQSEIFMKNCSTLKSRSCLVWNECVQWTWNPVWFTLATFLHRHEKKIIFRSRNKSVLTYASTRRDNFVQTTLALYRCRRPSIRVAKQSTLRDNLFTSQLCITELNIIEHTRCCLHRARFFAPMFRQLQSRASIPLFAKRSSPVVSATRNAPEYKSTDYYSIRLKSHTRNIRDDLWTRLPPQWITRENTRMLELPMPELSWERIYRQKVKKNILF